LFLAEDRQKIIHILASLLKPGGIFTLTCLSTYDTSNYGVCDEIEENTFVKHQGKPLHYFEESELPRLLWYEFDILHQVLHIQIELDSNGEEEDLYLWFIAAQKGVESPYD
jgi:hypothetical protein